jgi:hypothetical protein
MINLSNKVLNSLGVVCQSAALCGGDGPIIDFLLDGLNLLLLHYRRAVRYVN